MQVCLDLRDSLIYWAVDAKQIEETEGFDRMLEGIQGKVWDVGCNIGLFSLYAAAKGNQVVAFDISEKALALLRKSAQRNSLNIITVDRAFSVIPFKYAPPANADVQNRPDEESSKKNKTSITYFEAAAEFGTPTFIKMDIESAEVDFLKSKEFKAWVKQHNITLLIELHQKHYWDLVWQDLPHRQFDSDHVLLNPIQTT